MNGSINGFLTKKIILTSIKNNIVKKWKFSALLNPVENVLKLYQTNSECLWTILTFSKLVCICMVSSNFVWCEK